MSWGNLRNQEDIGYHVHINVHLGQKRAAADKSSLTELKSRMETIGLHEDSFLPEGSGYESTMHLTAKFGITDKAGFVRVKEATSNFLRNNTHLYRACYQENEAIPVDMRITDRPFEGAVSLGFKVGYGEDPPGIYKQAELHASARNRDLVDPRIHTQLLAAGFFPAYLPKPEGTVAAVYTITGTLPHIRSITQPTYDFLESVGGFPEGSLKVEVMADEIQVFGEPIIEFMPLIQSVEFL